MKATTEPNPRSFFPRTAKCNAAPKTPRPLVLGSKCAAGRGSESGNGAYSPAGFQD